MVPISLKRCHLRDSAVCGNGNIDRDSNDSSNLLKLCEG